MGRDALIDVGKDDFAVGVETQRRHVLVGAVQRGPAERDRRLRLGRQEDDGRSRSTSRDEPNGQHGADDDRDAGDDDDDDDDDNDVDLAMNRRRLDDGTAPRRGAPLAGERIARGATRSGQVEPVRTAVREAGVSHGVTTTVDGHRCDTAVPSCTRFKWQGHYVTLHSKDTENQPCAVFF